jgi:hypothetical protein
MTIARPLETGARTITYEELKKCRVFVNAHWDINLGGLCRIDGELCRFRTIDDHDKPLVVEVFKMTPWQKVRALWKKKLFEICVGRHWTFPDRDLGVHYQRGGVFKRTLTWLYYGCRTKWGAV